MSAELSIAITSLKKEAASIAGSGRTNAPPVAEKLTGRIVPPEGQPATDFLALQLGLVHMVETGLEQIETYDESLVAELDEDREKLTERNAATEELTDVLTDVQNATDAVYGADVSLRLFGHVETLPTDPVALTKLGKRVHRRLNDPEYPLPEPKLKGWALSDRQTAIGELGASVERLDLAQKALIAERKASQGSRFFKEGVVEEFRRTLRYAAGCLASLYGLAGMEDLAARIRPKRRQRRRSAGGDDGGDAAETPAVASPESADDAAELERPAGPTLVVS